MAGHHLEAGERYETQGRGGRPDFWASRRVLFVDVGAVYRLRPPPRTHLSPVEDLDSSLGRLWVRDFWLGSANEWHRRRETPARKHSGAVSRSQLFRSLPECRDEPGIGDPELLVHLRAHRMEQRCCRSLRTRRSIVRMLPSDGRSLPATGSPPWTSRQTPRRSRESD